MNTKEKEKEKKQSLVDQGITTYTRPNTTAIDCGLFRLYNPNQQSYFAFVSLYGLLGH